jgi:hypothetical protein
MDASGSPHSIEGRRHEEVPLAEDGPTRSLFRHREPIAPLVEGLPLAALVFGRVPKRFLLKPQIEHGFLIADKPSNLDKFRAASGASPFDQGIGVNTEEPSGFLSIEVGLLGELRSRV